MLFFVMKARKAVYHLAQAFGACQTCGGKSSRMAASLVQKEATAVASFLLKASNHFWTASVTSDSGEAFVGMEKRRSAANRASVSGRMVFPFLI